jgi:hypothetical protein
VLDGAGAIPSAAHTRSWPTRELNGIIYLWHDTASRPPLWEPLPFPAPSSGLFSLLRSLCGASRTTYSHGSTAQGQALSPPSSSAAVSQGSVGTWLGCDGGWRFHGRTRHFVSVHIQDIPENGVDIKHFDHLHTPLYVCWDVFECDEMC